MAKKIKSAFDKMFPKVRPRKKLKNKRREISRGRDNEFLDTFKDMPCLLHGDETGGCFGDVIPEHVTTKGAWGKDTPDNVMALCVYHHREKDKGYLHMIQKYPTYLQWLRDMGREDIIDRASRSLIRK